MNAPAELKYRLITRSDMDGLVCAVLLKELGLLGEIVFQIGLIVVTVTAAPDGWALAAGVAGPLYIAILMYYAARDQDHQQSQR